MISRSPDIGWFLKKMKLLSVFLRKIASVYILLGDWFHSISVQMSAVFSGTVKIGGGCSFGKDTKLRATDGGKIVIGSRTSFGANVTVIAKGGAVIIGDDVFVGDGTIIVSRDLVEVGSDSLIAEYVVIRDQDHEIDSRPIRIAGFKVAPVRVGRDVWIGCKASVLRGVSIGDGAVIGAHSLVRNSVEAGVLAAGTPARIVRRVVSE